MGCINSKQTQIGHPTQFKISQQIQESVYSPLTSTLYNTLRKKNDVQIIRNSKIKQPIFKNELTYDTQILKPNDIKLLCNFKNVLLVQPQDSIVQQIKRNSTPKCIYAISEQQAKVFLNLFPIFSFKEENKYQPKTIPIMAFSQQQIVKGKKKKLFFLHSEKFNNEQIYRKLGIEHIVKNSQNQKISTIVANLRKSDHSKILFIHNVSTTQQNLLDILCQFGKLEYNIDQQGSRRYFQNILPQTKTTDKIIMKSQSIIKNQQNQNMSLTQIFEKDLKKLYEEMGGDQASMAKIQRAYNLIINLISNIYNSKQSDNFRKVRKTNKQINQLLGRFKYGIKLLEDIGFVDEGGFFVNNIDPKYLKVYRTDLDVAYKKFISKK